jgi:hypothetical protein
MSLGVGPGERITIISLQRNRRGRTGPALSATPVRA